MRRSIVFVATGFVALLTGAIAGHFVVNAQTNAKTYTPAILTERSTAYDADGGEVSPSERIVALRSDGSQASFYIYEPRRRNVRTIETPDGSRTTIVDDLKALSRVQMSEKAVDQTKQMRAAPQCAFRGGSLLWSESLHGVQVYVIEYHVPPKMLRLREWRAPEYGCFPLRATLEERQHDGSYRLTGENVITKIQNGQPDTRYFDVPTGYENVTPAELKARRGTCSLENKE